LEIVRAVGPLHNVPLFLGELVGDPGPIDGLAFVQVSKGRPDRFDKGPEIPPEVPSKLGQGPQSFAGRGKEPQEIGFQVFSVDHSGLARNDGRVGKYGKAHEAKRDGLSVKVGEKDHDQTVDKPQQRDNDDAKGEFFR